MQKKLSIFHLIAMQLVVIIYSVSTVMAKLAAKEELISFRGIMFYALYIGCLGIYAIFWQQLIKRVELSIAYANRCMNLLWSSLWAIFLFHEKLSITNTCGLLLVLIGTFFVNSVEKDSVEKDGDGKTEKKEKEASK